MKAFIKVTTFLQITLMACINAVAVKPRTLLVIPLPATPDKSWVTPQNRFVCSRAEADVHKGKPDWR